MLAMRVGEDTDMSGIDPKVKTMLELVKEQFTEVKNIVNQNTAKINDNITNLQNLDSTRASDKRDLNKQINNENKERQEQITDTLSKIGSLKNLVNKNKEDLDSKNIKFEESLEDIIV